MRQLGPFIPVDRRFTQLCVRSFTLVDVINEKGIPLPVSHRNAIHLWDKPKRGEEGSPGTSGTQSCDEPGLHRG